MLQERVAKLLLQPVLCACALIFMAIGAANPAAANPNNGFYFGLFLAGLFAEQDVTEISDPGPPPTIVVGTADLDGIAGTLAIGYRAPIATNIIAGIEGDVTVGNFEDTYDGDVYDSSYLATIRALLGFQVNNNILLYLTGGIAFLDAKYTGEVAPPVAMLPPAVDDELLTGFTIGGGGEITTPIGVNIRMQYLYANFEDWDFFVGQEYYDVETEAHVAQIGFVVPFPK